MTITYLTRRQLNVSVWNALLIVSPKNGYSGQDMFYAQATEYSLRFLRLSLRVDREVYWKAGPEG